MMTNTAPTPFLLRVAMVLGAVFGLLGTGVGVVGLLVVALSGGPHHIGDQVVSRAELAKVAVPFLILYVCACVTAGLASWAIWKRRAASRTLLVMLLVEFVIGDAAMLVLARNVAGTGASELAVSASIFATLVVVWLWYLFRKRSVVRYYTSVR